MGSDSDSSNVKSMAPMVGLKLQVSHSLAVFMSTAIFVLGMNGRSQVAERAIDDSKLADHAAVFPFPGPSTRLPKPGAPPSVLSTSLKV